MQERITLRITETRNYSYYPNSNRLLTNGVYGFVYDANGNLIRKGTSFTITGVVIELKDEGEYWEYRYDLLNRLTEVKKNGVTVAKYSYDETGLRVKKESGDGTIYYVFNLEGQVLYEEENREYVEYIYLLGRHFARVDGYRTATTEERTTYFYHTDHLGSTVLVTDETGATVWSTEYTPFGSLTFEEGKLKRAVKFTGKDLDEDTGLYYFNARWYDQSIGRFISEDPIKDGLNLYIYCKNNPLKFIDLSGLAPTLAEAAEIAAHVYRIDEEAMKDELPGGWKRIEYYNRDTLQMGVYSREKEDGTMEYVVSNAGTREILDWAQNIKQPFGSSEYMINYIKYATYFVEKYSDSEITFVGHSKGGAEAAGNALATNKNAILFNPASINAYAYDLDVSKYTADMTAYIVKGEILNNIFGLISRPIDKMVYLPTQYSVNTPIEELNLVNSVRNHSMSAVKEAIKEWEEPKEKKWGPKWW